VSFNDFPKKAQSHVLGVFRKDKGSGQVKPLVRFVPTHTGSSPSPNFTFSLNDCSLNAGNADTSNTCYAVGPADFDTIYHVPSPLIGASPSFDGTGQAIAIVGDSEICTASSASVWQTTPVSQGGCGNADDVASFRSLFGLAANPPNIILDGSDPGLNQDETEGDLDVQWSGAVAPKATIDFVIAADTEASAGIDLAAEHIVDNNLAPVMSESFGVCEAFLGLSGNEFYSSLWEQAAAQGITVIVSAGDSGSAGCDDENTQQTAGLGLNVNAIASTPFNVATGGTDFDYTVANYGSTYWKSSNAGGTEESAVGYIPETTWNDSCAQSFSSLTCASATSASSSLNIVGGSGGQSNCLNPTS
jgi:subtilase family serine protease